MRDSDATLLLSPGDANSSGTRFTRELASSLGRPLLAADPCVEAGRSQVISFVEQHCGGGCLNVAGPRESESPGIYAASMRFLLQVFRSAGEGLPGRGDFTA